MSDDKENEKHSDQDEVVIVDDKMYREFSENFDKGMKSYLERLREEISEKGKKDKSR